MTERQAENLANLLIGAAAAGAAYYILRDPVLRRAALRLSRVGISAGASWLIAECRRAWAETPARPAEPSPRL